MDDRAGVSPGVKFTDAELLGVPTILVVGRGLADGVVEVKDRATGERTEIKLADAVPAPDRPDQKLGDRRRTVGEMAVSRARFGDQYPDSPVSPRRLDSQDPEYVI